MKKILLLLVFANLAAGGLAGGLFYLANSHPLTPANQLYRLQVFAENVRISFPKGAVDQAELALDQVEHRLQDLASATSAGQIELAGEYLHQALLEGADRIRLAEPQDQLGLMNTLNQLYQQVSIVVAEIPEEHKSTVVIFLKNNIGNFLHEESQALPPKKDPAPVDAAPVTFLNAGFDHTHFALEGAHKENTCSDCHIDGIYNGTSKICGECHQLDELLLEKNDNQDIYADPLVYEAHFEGVCEGCHNTFSWIPYQFDHNRVTECVSCHQRETPTVEMLKSGLAAQLFGFLDRREYYHYPGACVMCHKDTSMWQEIEYEHEEDSTCEPCHLIHTPLVHYPGECTLCHEDTSDWLVLEYDHEGISECESCHQNQTPENHYLKPCMRCHKEFGFWEVVEFDHSGYTDCEGCHLVNRPTDHFPGGCTLCHQANSWYSISFDHNGHPDCQTCHEAPKSHSSKRCLECHQSENWEPKEFNHKPESICLSCHKPPFGHYEKPCSNCHTFTSWTENWFNHQGFTDCNSCHFNSTPREHNYGLSCSVCHVVSSWMEIVFTHTPNSACGACHTPPANHYGELCENCHISSSWQKATFDHTGYDYCSGCHVPPSGHWPGQCDKCHGTNSWGSIDFDHTNYTDCKACHPRPTGHGRGQCSKCHNTQRWVDPITPTPYSTPLKSGTPMSTASTNTPGAPTHTPSTTITPTPPPTATPTPGG